MRTRRVRPFACVRRCYSFPSSLPRPPRTGGGGEGFLRRAGPKLCRETLYFQLVPCIGKAAEQHRALKAGLRLLPRLPESDACPTFSPFCFPLLLDPWPQILLQRVEISTESRPVLRPLKLHMGTRWPCETPASKSRLLARPPHLEASKPFLSCSRCETGSGSATELCNARVLHASVARSFQKHLWVCKP